MRACIAQARLKAFEGASPAMLSDGKVDPVFEGV
jgi:hypothetical protein